ncbi:MAG: DUF4381 domain-containing protein [Sulfurovum sp.]|uniref:DUF4381 domain-containing protein n=1 Tax=Sulfurovum sp. TaxID=1969726 RepID=UPI003C724997
MSVDMNQTIQEASLDNLHDIIIPDAVSFFPPAPGWFIVALLLFALIFHFVIQRYKHYKKSQYRREALKESVFYKENGKKNSKEDAVVLLALAKRVGIAAYGRGNIANLSEDSWWDFMQKHSKARVNTELRQEIEKLLYEDAYTMNSVLHDNIRQLVTIWIETHKMDSHV